MGKIIEVPITNLPMLVATRTDAQGTTELTAGTLNLFSGQLQIIPVHEKQTREILKSNKKQAMRTVTATARISTDLVADIFNRTGKQIEFRQLVADLCTLLSFGARRGVSFKPSRDWWGKGQPIVRGKYSSQGPVNIAETGTFIEKAIPKLYEPTFEGTLRIPTALRWFAAWHDAQFVEGKFITLWIVLEMLAKNYWKGQTSSPSNPTKDFDKAFYYLQMMPLPKVSLFGKTPHPVITLADVPLWEMYQARNSIVHGDPETAEKEMCHWFGQFAQERTRQLGGIPVIKSLPTQNEYGSCLYEAIDMLSRILEKVFLDLFGCKDFHFYNFSRIHAVWQP